jgi:hypothetical protein
MRLSQVPKNCANDSKKDGERDSFRVAVEAIPRLENLENNANAAD